MNTEELYPLPDALYDSKDWVASDYAGRVEWLHFMYESKRREVEQLETARPEQEPVAWKVWDRMGGGISYRRNKPHPSEYVEYDALYTHPPQRKPLTDEEIVKIRMDCWRVTPLDIYFARAIEKAHGIGGVNE